MLGCEVVGKITRSVAQPQTLEAGVLTDHEVRDQ